MLFPDRLRSQYFFCAMSLMALPASMRAAPAFRERLSDVEAATPAVSARLVNKLTTGCANRRPGKAPAATRQ
ncbi:hypothetical protein BZY49_07075 [Klebsiella pneumoniae]|nr:hypothetical protein BZY49_07075 [Klebsiella pneumoniae]